MNFKNYDKLSYGYRKCFISTNIDLLAFFVAPVSLIIVINFFLFVISVRLLLKVDNLNEKYIQQETEAQAKFKERLVLFLKLFFITGLTWIFGIISSILNDKYSFLWYIYIVLNSLQGLFIMISYLLKISFTTRFKKIFFSYATRTSEISSYDQHLKY